MVPVPARAGQPLASRGRPAQTTGATHRKEDEMVSKTLLDGKAVQVTFRMPPLEGVSELHLCGDFNGWNPTAVPLARQEDGSWTVTVVLEPGKSYRYRFRDGEGRWHNDWNADAYVPNSFGSEDSVVVVDAPKARRRPRWRQRWPRASPWPGSPRRRSRQRRSPRRKSLLRRSRQRRRRRSRQRNPRRNCPLPADAQESTPAGPRRRGRANRRARRVPLCPGHRGQPPRDVGAGRQVRSSDHRAGAGLGRRPSQAWASAPVPRAPGPVSPRVGYLRVATDPGETARIEKLSDKLCKR